MTKIAEHEMRAVPNPCLTALLWDRILSILATFIILRLSQSRPLKAEVVATDVKLPTLSRSGKLAGVGIGLTAVALLASSGLGLQLGLPTAICGALTAFAVMILKRESPLRKLNGVCWAVLPLVAGLFVLVEALDRTGLIRTISDLLRDTAQNSEAETVWSAGGLIAFACNLMNNLPASLIAGNAIHAAQAPDQVTSAVVVGVDLAIVGESPR
jgi:arsenical pump membrane protein